MHCLLLKMFSDGCLSPGKDSPYLECNIYIRTPGDIDVVTEWARTCGLDANHLTRLRYDI
jgi:hypothetical protein